MTAKSLGGSLTKPPGSLISITRQLAQGTITSPYFGQHLEQSRPWYIWPSKIISNSAMAISPRRESFTAVDNISLVVH